MSKSEYKFKVGDKVRCVEGFSWPEEKIELKFGSENTIIDVSGVGSISFNFEDYWRADRFELVKEETKVKEFDLHKDKWFIRTPTPEISEAVQLWLFDQGLVWQYHKDTEIRYQDRYIIMSSHCDTDAFCWTNDTTKLKLDKLKEIKLTFKTVVDTVEYPKPEILETPSQKELRILKEQIEQLTQQANKLETTLKGEV